MTEIVLIGAVIACLSFLGIAAKLHRSFGARRLRFIETYAFPRTIFQQVKNRYPHLSDAQLLRVEKGLRSYFKMIHLAGPRMISMPSQAVDVAWHAFILFTRDYAAFCQQAFGRFLHHTPA